MKSKVQEELKHHFRPEFLNRVDDTIVFHQLTEDEIVTIVDLMIAKVDERLKDRDMGLELRPTAKALLAQRGYDPVFGARPLRRTIQRSIEDNLSEKILFGELRAGPDRHRRRRAATARRRSSRSRACPSPTRFLTRRPPRSRARARRPPAVLTGARPTASSTHPGAGVRTLVLPPLEPGRSPQPRPDP